ncbi:NACHT domain-containing protein [Kocuria sp. UCD-OTCP]|uniref:NACHT domain-containing protein n=1 Tax=Kocuria sp. UCD-OTCP TaxID=1292021 RepID=UPI00042196C8|nr:NACHT domain-containing protein [Kocuria sp. UCD-OTCP]
MEPISIVIGTASAKAIARLWLQSEAAVDLSHHMMDQLSPRVSDYFTRKKTTRQFEQIADRIAQQLEPIIDAEYNGLADNEKQAAILGAKDALESIQTIDSKFLFKVNLEPAELVKLIQECPAYRQRASLIAAAQNLYDRLVDENCHIIIETAKGLPSFNSDALVEILKRQSELEDTARKILERMPQAIGALQNSDQTFELAYRRNVATRLGRLHLFGVPLDEYSSSYDLNVAYISLSTASGAKKNGTYIKRLKEEADANINHTASKKETQKPNNEIDSNDMRVEQALAQGNRHLIRGEAGSGKTTLLQWLAINAARKQLSGDLIHWRESVPIFLQLRRYTNSELPAPEAFINESAPLVGGAMPKGWAHRILESGQAILLIDGVDEIPEKQRAEAKQWLRELVRMYPGCKYVVTSRPPAVSNKWLSTDGFVSTDLLPMGKKDVENFVSQWHDAALKSTSGSPEKQDEFEGYERELINVIRDNKSVASLASTPLLCAMLCALNRDRKTQLPSDRMELYRIALETLLDRRDAERKVSQAEEIRLSMPQKSVLLQGLAFNLILNGQSDVSRENIIKYFDSRLKYMTSISSSSDLVFNQILLRSGLLREPIEGRFDFIHRTFQEYLAAQWAMAEGMVGALVDHAHLDQWREVVILAAGHGSQSECDELILGLINRGNNSIEFRHSLHILAVACLETVVQLSPEAQAVVHSVLKEVIPPTNMTDARAVASAGSVAVPLLSNVHNQRATTVAACIRSLCLIGDDESLHALKKYRDDSRKTVQRELIRGWDYFNRVDYAREILVNQSSIVRDKVIRDVESLEAIGYLADSPLITFDVPEDVPDLSEVPNKHLVDTMRFHNTTQIFDTENLTDYAKLSVLSISSSRIQQIPLLPNSIKHIELYGVDPSTDLSALTYVPDLESLSLAWDMPDWSLLGDAHIKRLELLSMTEVDLVGIKPIKSLKGLSVDVISMFGDDDVLITTGVGGGIEYVSRLHELESLFMSGTLSCENLSGLPPKLKSLYLRGASNLVDATGICELSELVHLNIVDAPYLSPSFLKCTSSVEELGLYGCDKVISLRNFESNTKLVDFSIRSIMFNDLSGIENLSALESLHVDCPSLKTLDPLLRLDHQITLTVCGQSHNLITSEIENKHTVQKTQFSYFS